MSALGSSKPVSWLILAADGGYWLNHDEDAVN